MFIAAYEHLKDSIIDQGRSFFTLDDKLSNDYGAEVLGRHKKSDVSTLLWIKENGGISDKEIDSYARLTRFRNEVVHEYIRVLTDKDFSGATLFQSLLETVSLIEMIESWFFLQSPQAAIMNGEAQGDMQVLSPSALVFKKILLQLFESH